MSNRLPLAPSADPTASAAPVGIGGWLLVFTVGLVPHLVLSGRHIAAALQGAPGTGGLFGALAVLTLVGHGLGLLLIVRRHRFAPAFFTLYLPLAIAAAVLTPEVGTLQAAEAGRLGIADAAAQARMVASATVRIAVGVLVAALWIGYWARSRRIRATFGSTGLEAFRQTSARALAA